MRISGTLVSQVDEKAATLTLGPASLGAGSCVPGCRGGGSCAAAPLARPLARPLPPLADILTLSFN